MEAPDESPYALALRLSAEGAPAAAIQEALTLRGLSPEEVVTVLAAAARQQTDHRRDELARQAKLVEIDPARQSIAELKRHDERVGSMNLVIGLGLTAIGVLIFFATGGQLIAYGAVLVGLTRVAASLFRPRRLPRPPELPDEDTTPRCAEHPKFGSAGTCPRCGNFRCAECAPAGGFKGRRVCRVCAAGQPYREETLRVASRRVALALFAVPAISAGALVFATALFPQSLEGTAIGLAAEKYSLVVCLAALVSPFLVLGALQFAVRHPWPALAGLAVSAMLALVLMDLTDGDFEPTMAVLAFPAVALALLLPEHWTRYTDARA